MLDALVSGIAAPHIRHLLLAQEDLTLTKAITLAKAQLTASKSIESYAATHAPPAYAPQPLPAAAQAPYAAPAFPPQPPPSSAAVQGTPGPRCYFCGHGKHPRNTAQQKTLPALPVARKATMQRYAAPPLPLLPAPQHASPGRPLHLLPPTPALLPPPGPRCRTPPGQ